MRRLGKFKGVILCLGVLFSFCAAALAQDMVLCLDAKNNQKMPKNFRAFADTKMSGSAQFSDNGLQLLKQEIPSNKITIVDLRQESHGLVNGIAVSWFSARNEANVGKSLAEIAADEQNKLYGLLQSKEVVIASKFAKDADTGEKKVTKTLDVTAENVATEEQLVKAQGLQYFRLPVLDHRRPGDSDVDQFVSFVRSLPEDTWLHFHCKAGRGRTTTFMVMYDMMKNAKTTSMENIFARHSETGGIDFNFVHNDWRQASDKERTEFIKKFYQYCKTNNDNFATSWSSWVSAR